jgi:hypothetical protein
MQDAFICDTIFKDNINFEVYLSTLPLYLRHALSEFRLGSFMLSVNSLNNDVPRVDKICTKCDMNKLMNIIFYLNACCLTIKIDYIRMYFRVHLNTLRLSQLLNNPRLAKFIFNGFKLYNNPPN